MRRSDTSETVHALARMLQDEAAVRQAICILQQHCLSGGLTVRFPGNVAPTPHFARHIQRVFVPFCREAIQSFLVVGFVPYRIRTLSDGCQVPEALPLGTFSWCVSRDPTLLPKSWFFDRQNQQMNVNDLNKNTNPTTNNKKMRTSGPLLSYEVHTSFTDQPPMIYTFTTPSTLYPCTSALSSLMRSYDMLCHKRGCMLRADMYNSKPSLVFEEQYHGNPTQAAEKGSAIQNSVDEISDAQRERKKGMGTRQNLHYDIFNEARARSQLPEESVTLVAPINHSVHSLDKALSPQDLNREELGFMRLIAVAVGLPPALLLQGSAVIGTAAVSTSAATMGWADSAESSNRQLIETCNHINGHLQMLLEDIYCAIYPTSGVPRFNLRALPTLCLEQLSSVFDARLIDDDVFSSILKVSFFILFFLVAYHHILSDNHVIRLHGAQSSDRKPSPLEMRSGAPSTCCLSNPLQKSDG